MLHSITMRLEHRAEIAGFYSVGRMAKRILGMLLTFLDNDPAVAHLVTTAILFNITRKFMGGGTIASSNGYAAFLHTWPYSERNWSILLGSIVILSLSAFFFKSKQPRKNHAGAVELYQFFCAGVLFATHLEIACVFYQGNAATTATGTFTIMACFSLVVVYRIWRRGGMWIPS